MTLPPHIYDDHDWLEIDPANPDTLPAGTQRVDVRHRNEIVTPDALASAIDWSPHVPPRPYDPIAWRPARRA